MGDWIGVAEAAELLEVSKSTVLRSLADPATADEHWGPGNWRVKPLTSRKEFQVSRARAAALAGGAGVHGGPSSDPAPPDRPVTDA